jgi:hypothetical protein
MYVSKYSDLWKHTQSRINGFLKKAEVASIKNGTDKEEEFTKLMVTRLRRIKHEEKIHYTIEVLKEMGYQDIIDIYDGKLVMNALTKDLDFLDDI